jgi:hypothetical protein
MSRLVPKLDASALKVPLSVLVGLVLGFAGGLYAGELQPNSTRAEAKALRVERVAQSAADSTKNAPSPTVAIAKIPPLSEWAPPAEIAGKLGVTVTERRSAAKAPLVWQPPAEIAKKARPANASAPALQ